MQTKIFALLIAFFVTNAFAADIWQTEGEVKKTSDGYVITGKSGGDDFPGLRLVIPSTCAGKKFTLTADYKATEVKGGSKSYHGIHFDYEMMAGGVQKWAPDWRAAPSDEFRSVKREWIFPPNMTEAVVRIGLQGVDGELVVKNLQSSGC
jgi:hypothetical protein